MAQVFQGATLVDGQIFGYGHRVMHLVEWQIDAKITKQILDTEYPSIILTKWSWV
jgi:hypothetical protein